MADSSTRRTRYIFVTGGVVSSLGKGIAAASMGRLLVARGLTVGQVRVAPAVAHLAVLVLYCGAGLLLARRTLTRRLVS